MGRNLDLNANAAAALCFRAREALRQAYLAQHLDDVPLPDCERHADQLPRLVRGKLTRRARRVVEHHLESCRHCSTATATLMEINHRLGTLVLPAAVAARHACPDTNAEPAETFQPPQPRNHRWVNRTAAWIAGASVTALGATGVATSANDSAPVATQAAAPVAAPTSPVSVADHTHSGWRHLSIPVSADHRTTFTLNVTGSDAVVVHRDDGHGNWSCVPTPDASASRRRYVCTVPEDQRPSPTVSLDVRPSTRGAGVSLAVTNPSHSSRTYDASHVEVSATRGAHRSGTPYQGSLIDLVR